MKHGDTLLRDEYASQTIDYVLSKRLMGLLIRDNGVCDYALAA